MRGAQGVLVREIDATGAPVAHARIGDGVRLRLINSANHASAATKLRCVPWNTPAMPGWSSDLERSV
jgi:hypothetical protein